MVKKRSSTYKYLYLIFSIFILNDLSAQTDDLGSYGKDTIYIYKTDTIHITPVIPCFSGFGLAPPPELNTNKVFMFGIGSANMYDTYLSPLKYTGTSLRVFNERMRRTTWFNYRFYKQQVIELEVAIADNPAKTATEYWALMNYRLGGHYELYADNKFRLGVGGLWDVAAGVLYNERNGNNPATARLYTNLNASVIASYKFKHFAVRWQIDTPMLGMLFSPEYGQSYYELSMGNSVRTVNFASLHNQRALRNYITVDVPIYKYTVRVGYLGSYYQTKVHSINTHNYTHSFVFGFPIEGVKRSKRNTDNIYWSK